MSDLEWIRDRYRLPNNFFLAIPFEEAHHRRSRFVTLYEDALMVGLRLSLHPFARDLLTYLSVTPSQLALNGGIFLMRAIHLWSQMFGYQLTLQEFL